MNRNPGQTRKANSMGEVGEENFLKKEILKSPTVNSSHEGEMGNSKRSEKKLVKI